MRFLPLLLLTAFVQSIHAGNHPALIHWESDSLPVITCPGSVTLITDSFTCEVAFDYEVTASGEEPINIQQLLGLPSGSSFPIGTTPNGFMVTDVQGNTATCTFNVVVLDPVSPTCIPPAPVSVVCEQFDPTLTSYGMATGTDNCCMNTTTDTALYDQFDTLCLRGTITRLFQAKDCSGNTSSCTQRIIVNYEQDYYIKFPNDQVLTNCNSTGVYGEPLFFGEDCELLGVSFEDEFTGWGPDACYKFERVWTVINWCTYNPSNPLIWVPNPTPNAIPNSPVNLPGPTVSACGALPPWQPTIVKISPVDSEATNYCTFWSANANGYQYKQLIKILDLADPVTSSCPTSGLTFADSSFNHPFYWNGLFNPLLPSQDLTETEVALSFTGTDDCAGSNVYLSYLLFLDLDADGVMESVINSNNPPPADTIYYNNHLSPSFIGGTPRPFDNRPVPQTQKWQFKIAQSVQGLERTASVRWTSIENPVGIVPELPVGTHKIKWLLEDGCGNEYVCEHTFTVQPNTISALETVQDKSLSLRLEPNPVTDQARLSVYLPEREQTVLSVFSADGQLVQRETATHDAGTQLFTLDAKAWGTSGVYWLRLEAGARVGWCKVVRM
ncbi:MAG TPA: hypothetical protein DCF33_05610 [Saprospirales bacterium]|nr:hypothetical protein [Saprospirales bacterium]